MLNQIYKHSMNNCKRERNKYYIYIYFWLNILYIYIICVCYFLDLYKYIAWLLKKFSGSLVRCQSTINQNKILLNFIMSLNLS